MTFVGFLADAREILLTTGERMSVGSSSRPRRVRTMKCHNRNLRNTNVRRKLNFDNVHVVPKSQCRDSQRLRTLRETDYEEVPNDLYVDSNGNGRYMDVDNGVQCVSSKPLIEVIVSNVHKLTNDVFLCLTK